MILFRVASHIQLISAILLKNQLEDTADIHLINITSFSDTCEKLRKTGIFRKVVLCDDRGMTDRLFLRTERERAKVFKECPNLWNVELDCEYDDYYMGHDTLFNKLFYYFLLKHQKRPNVYLLEDGLASYDHDVFNYAMADAIDHDSYKENSILKHIRGQYLYQPNLYLQEERFKILKFPPINDTVRQTLFSLYGKPQIPKERFILFTSCFPENRTTANELDVVRMIAEATGKENLIIKQHPRAVYDPYTMRDYKVMESSGIPWEIFLLSGEMQNKVLMTACSYAVFTAHGMFGHNQPVIFLYKHLKGNFALPQSAGFIKFITKLSAEYNKEIPQVFCPATAEELHEALKYIEGRWPN